MVRKRGSARRAQAATEQMVLTGIILVLLIPLLFFLSQGKTQSPYMTDTVNTLDNVVESLSNLGSGSSDTIVVNVPNIESAQFDQCTDALSDGTTQCKVITINYGGTVDQFEMDYFVGGSLDFLLNKGIHYLTLFNDGTNGQIVFQECGDGLVTGGEQCEYCDDASDCQDMTAGYTATCDDDNFCVYDSNPVDPALIGCGLPGSDGACSFSCTVDGDCPYGNCDTSSGSGICLGCESDSDCDSGEYCSLGVCNTCDADGDGEEYFYSSSCGNVDCDDTNDQINTLAGEGVSFPTTCGDTKDNNCNGLTDCADSACDGDSACVGANICGNGIQETSNGEQCDGADDALCGLSSCTSLCTCYGPDDADGDGLGNCLPGGSCPGLDNCPLHPNGVLKGTCVTVSTSSNPDPSLNPFDADIVCTSNADCAGKTTNGVLVEKCSTPPNQANADGDSCGDACDYDSTDNTVCNFGGTYFCGNNNYEPAGGEQCDGADDTACPGYCQIDCTCGVIGACGNNVLEAGETCDDGNTANGDGCDSSCQTEGGPGICGNGVIEGAEHCDDGDTINDGITGCDADCTYTTLTLKMTTYTVQPGSFTKASIWETNWYPNTYLKGTVKICDNSGYNTATETCIGTQICGYQANSGTAKHCDVYPPAITGQYGYYAGLKDVVSTKKIIVVPGCGNGVIEFGEQCDDGNGNNNDGCNNDCTLSGTPPPPSVCGNGQIEPGEVCDPGAFSGTPPTDTLGNNCNDFLLQGVVQLCNGVLQCNNDCSAYDVSTCEFCDTSECIQLGGPPQVNCNIPPDPVCCSPNCGDPTNGCIGDGDKPTGVPPDCSGTACECDGWNNQCPGIPPDPPDDTGGGGGPIIVEPGDEITSTCGNRPECVSDADCTDFCSDGVGFCAGGFGNPTDPISCCACGGKKSGGGDGPGPGNGPPSTPI